MILDGHIHIKSIEAKKEPFLSAMKQSGVDGGIVLSASPSVLNKNAEPYKQRIEHVVELCRGEQHLYPFFFIDPTEETAPQQVDYALKSGIAGFKIICNKFYPSDPRAVEIYRLIAANNKPVLFHSGILWDGLNASGNFNKPTEFEVLLSIPELRFALAHISWPWCDECVAVYGKFNNATRWAQGFDGSGVEMFIDDTPGTPKIYRREALKRVLFSGYDILQNLYFGLDNTVDDYNIEWAKDWIETDRAIYREFGLNDDAIDGIFSGNLLRFIAMEPRR